MTRERWQQVCDLLEQALEIAPHAGDGRSQMPDGDVLGGRALDQLHRRWDGLLTLGESAAGYMPG